MNGATSTHLLTASTNPVRTKLAKAHQHMRFTRHGTVDQSDIYRFCRFLGEQLQPGCELTPMEFHVVTIEALNSLQRSYHNELSHRQDAFYEDLRDKIPEIYGAVLPQMADVIREMETTIKARRVERLDFQYNSRGVDYYRTGRVQHRVTGDEIAVLVPGPLELVHSLEERSMTAPLYIASRDLKSDASGSRACIPDGATHYIASPGKRFWTAQLVRFDGN